MRKEAEKGRKGERRQETIRTIKIIRSRYRYGIKNISGWEVNGHWSLVKRLRMKMVIGYWSLVISKEAETKKGRRETVSRKLVWLFVIWDL